MISNSCIDLWWNNSKRDSFVCMLSFLCVKLTTRNGKKISYLLRVASLRCIEFWKYKCESVGLASSFSRFSAMENRRTEMWNIPCEMEHDLSIARHYIILIAHRKDTNGKYIYIATDKLYGTLKHAQTFDCMAHQWPNTWHINDLQLPNKSQFKKNAETERRREEHMVCNAHMNHRTFKSEPLVFSFNF